MTTARHTYAWTSPYHGSWVEHFYRCHFHNLYGSKIITERHFRDLLETVSERPQIMLMGNFILDRAAIVGLCRAENINVTHCEDGFFPHYQTMHADPLGFCWESSLPRMIFRVCRDGPRTSAQQARRQWLAVPRGALPPGVKKPFVLWPLQLPGDRVNQCDLRVSKWDDLIQHFRDCLPRQFQLVLKEHPKGRDAVASGVAALATRLPNTILVPRQASLPTLLHEANAVAGANSTVLYEARLIHYKPTYAYARSWFTHHEELFLPIRHQTTRPLPRSDWLEHPASMRTERLDDYTDWFLAQLLARQITRQCAASDPEAFRHRVHRLSYSSFREYGEEVFD
jgi:hypothetical protein